MDELTTYEKQALAEIDRFTHPEPSSLGSLWQRLSGPLDRAAEAAFDTTLGAAAVRTVQEVVEVLNDGATWTVRRGAIVEAYAAEGHDEVKMLRDIHGLSLQDVDQTAASLRTKYQGIALVEGVGSGLLGGLAIAADVGLVVAIALRAANEYATYFGFDVSAAGERLFVVRILSAASSPTVAERTTALADLSQLAVDLSRSDGWRPPESSGGVRVTKKIAEALAVRLLKAKLGQAVPIAGAAIAGGYNAWFVGAVADTAKHLYRQRFLIQKHGEALLAHLDR